MKRTRHALLISILLMGPGCSSPDTASDKPVAAGMDDISSYRLSMDKIDKLHQAQLKIGLAVKKMSVAQREAIKNSSSSTPKATLDDMVANIEKHKPYDDAINAAGLSAREYTTIMMAMMQAAMASSVLEMRPNDNQDSLLRAMKVNKDNLEFMRANQAEIGRRQEAIVAEMKRLGLDEES